LQLEAEEAKKQHLDLEAKAEKLEAHWESWRLVPLCKIARPEKK